MDNYNNTSNPYGDQLAYDLRQRYAKIVGDHMELIAQARIDRNYSEYFVAIENLFVVVRHKFKKLKEDVAEYNKLKTYAIQISNSYRNSWLNQNNNPN